MALLLLGMYRAWKAVRLSFVLLTTGLPLALIWGVSYWRPIYLSRHVVFALPGVVLLLLDGVLSFKPLLRSALIVLFLGTGVLAQTTPFMDQSIFIPWSEVAAWMSSHVRADDLVVFAPPFQRSAFDIKYDGPPLDERGIGEYEAYVNQADAVLGVHLSLNVVRGWVVDRPSFWLLEDMRWPTDWEEWDYQGTMVAEFPGLRIYEYRQRR